MSIAEVAEQSVPFALNLNAKFRNTEVRTGVLISGSSGWENLRRSLNMTMTFVLGG